MPQIDFPIETLRDYRGRGNAPDDFDAYWARALSELEGVAPDPCLTRVDPFPTRGVECFDLWFTGIGGARIYAKFLRPAGGAPAPCVLRFHGYTGSSGDWASHLALASQGFAVAALDVRGQGGLSGDGGFSGRGNSLCGHIVRGIEDGEDCLFYRRVFLDTAQLARVVASFPEIDASRLATTGGSQGGALSLACAALVPSVKRCIAEYPFLSDYRRVWEMDLAKQAYVGLSDWFRRFDPLHEREDEIFRMLGYIDVRHLAPRIRAETLMAITLMDPVCPPSTQFAAYNAIGAPKQSLVYPDFAHEGLPGFGDHQLAFLAPLRDG